MINLLGDEGIGKSLLANFIGSFFKDHYFNLDGASKQSHFNGFLALLLMANLDEFDPDTCDKINSRG